MTFLRNAYDRGPKSEPFDEHRAWDLLTSLAFKYFCLRKFKQEMVSAADRIKRLRKTAKVLSDACRLFDEAKQDELIEDLYPAWYYQNVKREIFPYAPLVIFRFSDKFDEVHATLSTLHAAACKARDEVVLQQGRPTGSTLTPDIIDMLAHNYRQSTGLPLDKLTDKHFVEFVGTFLEAIGEARNRSKDYALESIKYSLRLKRRKAPRDGE